MSDGVRNVSATPKPQGKRLFLKGVAMIAILLMLGGTGLLDGCVCFHPSVKELPDRRPGQEGQKIEVHEDSSWVLSWFTRSPWEEKQQKPRYMDEVNRQYLDARRQQKPR